MRGLAAGVEKRAYATNVVGTRIVKVLDSEDCAGKSVLVDHRTDLGRQTEEGRFCLVCLGAS